MQRPAPSESPDLTDLHWNMILQCWSPITSRPSASMATKFLKRRSEALSSNDNKLPLDPLNVLLFGETGVDKSSIIELIIGQQIGDAAPGAPYYLMKHTAEITLRERRFKLWEVSSSTALMGLFQRLIAKRRLRASYNKLHRDGGAPLLLYCMRGTSAPTISREYQDFNDIVGSTSCVSIAAVVDGLEESLDDWWTKYEGDLKRLGMQFSHHMCITSSPSDPNTSRSRETICSFIESYA